ncbi:adenosylcobinamide kinase /adenosylcobinamide-phosphate guanylyltransferase [Yoonia tamlensis]|uniref:Bifunctional adenosylcobalamin biosynthesis protein n=1 Tax=Yoonia tamlensis TaxID=390270 RepID=A0A1I6GWF8_9RHOB|nr:bifunctional adenosylcobinamide kinase/adenosylcobinamide-phosphate guanylyltransferase [Yoonia tamlensis]SFR46532.1 adenosylcobinamide kinase /adenosylcobinamide-phosphate guanylyltransferase [Yoonia tamlensis]
MLPKLSLILGGAASGKSGFAETIVLGAGLRKIYIATAQVYDDEMAQKVARHRDQRGGSWTTIEEPVHIAGALATAGAGDVVLIDCATLWLTNVMLGDHDVQAQTAGLLAAIETCAAPIVIVSNEVGQGLVPDNALSRQFRNAHGQLNQDIAAKADLVVAVMAGLPMVLKGQLP